MYLKSIKAFGFKSFATKTELEFKQGITGIVGPNGSGKSNIVDAVRWVLGEQSVKALRGTNQMTDIIFTGSKSRDGQNRAMVSLTFDNTDHYLNSEFNELEVKRVVYKTGENEYYINNTKVRLKDIIDLFIDSGAGKESFNIISQGSVSDVINSKPEDRRTIFEEAAGVLKYKKRKEETERKLEKTKENIEKVDLVIEELLVSLEPLEEQAKKASKYNELKEKLEETEIALIADDIYNINEEYKDIKALSDKLNNEILNMKVSSSEDTSKIESLKLKSLKLDEEINKTNEEVINISNEIATLNSKKQIALERKNYEVEDVKLQNSIVALKENELNLQKDIVVLSKEIDDVKLLLTKKEKNKEEQEKELNKNLRNKDEITKEYNNLVKENYELKNKISILESNIENDTKVPPAVKAVLNNPRLSGIHGIIGKLLETKEEFVKAIEVTLGASSNVIVVDDEKTSKEAINYLKENKIGRATFFPLNIIKGRYIDKETLAKLEKEDGYLGIAKDLVTYDKTYEDIIANQLGNVIVVDNIDTLNKIGKLILYKYRVVSLDGEILYTGGSITGGALKNSTGILNEKYELEKLNKKEVLLKNDLTTAQDNLNKIEDTIRSIEEEINVSTKEIVTYQEQINHKKTLLQELEEKHNATLDSIKGSENLKENRLDEEIEKLLQDYYAKCSAKEIILKDLALLKEQRTELTDEISSLDLEYRKTNSEFNKKQNDLKTFEIKLGKMDVKLDNLLLTLNESYNITYEKARENYELSIDTETARLTVNKVKAEIRDLGEVNLGSISEYERVNKRYNFLKDQKEDLEKSIDSLTQIINEMDTIMKERFLETFNRIKTEFSIVFKKLFKGGEGMLSLTDPDNLLETGIEIVAEPPGKKLNSIGLLSGGEKTLTAISLLFAILNVKPVPFVILDEVEAALDEANVSAFGAYLQSKKDNSQFIIITHKKKTMEYADVLYGITMQESGVSKIVSVELED